MVMDPERLRNSANLPPGLRSALSSGASRPLPINTRQRLRQRVLAAGTVGAVASAATWAGWAKASAVVLMLAGAAGGGVFWLHKQESTVAEAPRAAAPPLAEPTTLANGLNDGANDAVAVTAEAPAEAVPLRARKRRIKRVVTPPSAAVERVAAPEPELDLAAETRLLSQAQAALHATPAAALAATDKHAARFPNGLLLAERELLAAEALLRLERAAEAEDRLRALIASQPGAIYTQRARRLMGSRAR